MKGVVAVVGGGPAGAAAAVGLAKHGAQAVVLDSGDGWEKKVGECLPPLVNPLLAMLGIADRLDLDGHLRSHAVLSAWGSSEIAERDFLFSSSGSGWHLDRSVFESRLATAALEAGAEWQVGVRVTEVQHNDSRWTVSGQSPRGRFSFKTDYLIDATGRRAIVARRLGIRRAYYDRLVGIAAILPCTHPNPSAGLFSLVEAAPDGWWYSAPLPNGQLSVVYLTDADLSGSRSARSIGGWRNLLFSTQHTRRRVEAANFAAPSWLQVVTAATSRLYGYVGDGWTAVGDSAATFDPISSHGIYSALAGGYQAGRAVARTLTGKSGALHEYTADMDRAFGEYLVRRADHYAVERRWSSNLFWLRRHREIRPGATQSSLIESSEE